MLAVAIRRTCSRAFLPRRLYMAKSLSTEASSSNTPKLEIPPPSTAEKIFDPKIRQLVDNIAKLSLLEVADLNDCLKQTLKIESVPMAMNPGMFAGMAPSPAQSGEEEEAAPPKAIKSSFTIKMISFDAGKKVALIKEVKNLVEGMNLVQAKKFVESVPQVIKSNIAKDEADSLKKVLEELGAVVEIE